MHTNSLIGRITAVWFVMFVVFFLTESYMSQPEQPLMFVSYKTS